MARKTAKKKAPSKNKAAAIKKKKTAPKKPSAKKVKFQLKATAANWASLVGDFNGWDIAAGAMKRGKGGCWEKTVKLKPGVHEYKFVVDGEWWSDPDNPDFVYNPYGTANSIAKV